MSVTLYDKKSAPRNFVSLRPATLLKKRLWYRCFPVDFMKFLRTPFYRTALTTGSVLLSFSLLLHYFENTVSRQSVEKSFG